ncbi:MAG: phospholipase D family protein [Candidatus Omnitrophica bacterium]|nr:phospholipase D family protein [Candidatus Omnitrophota bacterium]
MTKNQRYLVVILLSICSLSCRHLSRQQPLAPIEDLHIYEDVSFPESPFDGKVRQTFQDKTHHISILNVGDEALLARIHLIRAAQKAIYIQTFIWTNDEVGRWVVKELVKAAERGVKIKLMVDYLTLEKNLNNIAYLAAIHPNIEFKIYNPIAKKIRPSALQLIKGYGIDFKKTNRRMHNKIVVIDDRIGITGGRNIENDYYDRGAGRNFKDRDVLVVGPEVKSMTDSFMEYWNFRLSVAADDMVDIHHLIEEGVGYDADGSQDIGFNALFGDVDSCASDDGCIKEAFIDAGFDVKGKVEFVADKPGKSERIGKYKTTAVTDSVLSFLEDSKGSIVMQTPYLIVSGKSSKIFKRLRRNNPGLEILVSSNSLAAADHVHAYAFSFKNKKRYVRNFRWRIFEFKPAPKDADLMIRPIAAVVRAKKYYVCIHAKSYIFDDKIAWIGSFNLDPRSKYLNTEVGLVVHDETVAAALKKDIQRDMAPQNSWTIGKKKNIPVVSHVSDSIDDVMDAVPVVHVWPFRYTSNFELKEGKEEVPFYHEKFYENYDSVGPFPQMEMTVAEIETRLLKSFFGVVEGLM